MDENTSVAPAARRRRAAALAGLLLAAGALTACNSGSGGTGASASMTTPPASTSAGTPSTGSSTGTPSAPPATQSPVQSPTSGTSTPATSPTNPGIASGEPAPVKLLPALGYTSQGTTLTVYFYGGTCEQYGLKADESKPGQVSVRVVVTKAATPGRVCSQLVKKDAVTTQLSHPLEGRTVIDQSNGQEVPLDSGPAGGPQ
ncbi:hypothetical protein [Kitasatospora sp. McL0602]|uniref:hypothetical protein n=1 Tax=Kitasatospora sp. McL0602 TaxID=3439530 RepID=UPI003F88D529